MSEIKLTKRGQALVNNSKKNEKSEMKEWNYADYCKNYEKKLNIHKKSHKVSRFLRQLFPTVSEKICNMFKRAQGERKTSPAV